MKVQTIIGDCRSVLPTLPADSVHCVVTSPPYWGLRDYGTGTWEGGDPNCKHLDRSYGKGRGDGVWFDGGRPRELEEGRPLKGQCPCGARRVDRQIGLEPTYQAFIAEMVAVFREVRRVLRPDGTLWLNLGDAYCHDRHAYALKGDYTADDGLYQRRTDYMGGLMPKREGNGLKTKDLCGIPWRVAFALQEDGWVLRQDICWAKPNPMPESVTDRCTKSHEYIFLFAKAKWSGPEPGRYNHISAQDARWLALFFDAEGNLCLRRESAKGNDYGAHSAQIVLANSNRPLLEAAQRIVGDGSILERSGTNAPMYYWQLCGKKAADLLSVIYPHLIVKQRQARCLLHLESRKGYRGGHEPLGQPEIEYRDRLWEAVKSLNHFGDPDISWVPEPRFGRWSGCARYYYDAEAIKEDAGDDIRRPYGSPGANAMDPRGRQGEGKPRKVELAKGFRGGSYVAGEPGPRAEVGNTYAPSGYRRNKRSVWEIATAPFSEAHFATFPPALVEPCIKAGTSGNGCCSKCGAPWMRKTKTNYVKSPVHGEGSVVGRHYETGANGWDGSGLPRLNKSVETIGWFPDCTCQASVIPCTVLDPFGGAGTTGLVADRLQRNAILIELNPKYAEMAKKRIHNDAPLFAQAAE